VAHACQSGRTGIGTQQKTSMKMLMFSLGLALAVAGPALAGDVTEATTQADCERAGGVWDADAKKCSEKKM
jgi:hypothetical protein